MRFASKTRRVLAATILLASTAAPALATNGMYLAGYGSEAAGRGGANLAVADNALGLQANPAGIMHIRGRELDVDVQLLAPSLRYGGDPFGNRMDGKSKIFPMPSLSYVKGYAGQPWVWGIALISQGGMGATFEHYATPFGSDDRTSSEVRFATAWMFAADVRRYLWKHAMQQITVKGTSPDAASPMTEVTMPFVFDWKDQWVTNVGAEYAVNPALTVRAGYNYGESPVPDETLNPLFPATTLQHATAGLTWLVKRHTLNLAVEHAFEAEQVNPNTSQQVNPFGPGMFVDHSQWTVSFGVRRAF
jgi:long-subunit fatty acid transport protein